MNPPSAARIALAAILIFAASIAIGAEKKKPRSTGKHAASADESPLVLPTAIGELANYLEKLDKRKPKSAAEILDDRCFKITALFNLGRAEVANNQYKKGIARLREAVSLCELLPDPATWENTHIEYIAATAEHGDYAEAVRVAKIMLDRSGRPPGTGHINALASASKLADILTQKGELATAALLFRRILEVNESTLGPEHPETCRTAYGLALFYLNQKEFAKALPLAEQALKGWTKTLGNEHPNTIEAKKLVDELKETK